jgi:hypothetical protein
MSTSRREFQTARKRHGFGHLFNSLSDWAAGFVDASWEAFEEASEESLLKQCQHQEVSSALILTQVDLLMLEWAESHDETIPAHTHVDAEECVGVLEQELSEGRAAYLAGTDRQPPAIPNTSRVRDAAADIEKLLHAIQAKEGVITASDNLESQLDSGKILNPRIPACLHMLRAALGQQLSSCEHHHVARLKLTGFSGDFDHQMRLVLDLFLSSHYDWTPCRWLQSRCTIVE